MSNNEELNQISPPFEEVSAAYGEVLEYNREHTGIRPAIRRSMEVVFKHAVGEGTEDDSKDKTAEADMQGEIQEIIHEEVFMHAGIKLVPLGSYSVEGNDRIAGKALVPSVVNVGLFKDFLSKVGPEQVSEDSGAALLVDVALQLKKLIVMGFTDDGTIGDAQSAEAIEVSEEALRTWDAISDEYKRLGFSASVLERAAGSISDDLKQFNDTASGGDTLPEALADEDRENKSTLRYLSIFSTLEDAVDYWGQGILPEFIRASEMGLFRKEDRRYYFDGKIDEVGNDVRAIVELMSTPKTVELGLIAREKYIYSIRQTIRCIDAVPSGTWPNVSNNRQVMAEALNNLDAKIE